MKKTLKKSLVKRIFTNLENLKLLLGHLYQNHITEQKWKCHITFQSIIQKCKKKNITKVKIASYDENVLRK